MLVFTSAAGGPPDAGRAAVLVGPGRRRTCSCATSPPRWRRTGVQVNAIGTNFMDFPEFLAGQPGRRTPRAGPGSRPRCRWAASARLDELAALRHGRSSTARAASPPASSSPSPAAGSWDDAPNEPELRRAHRAHATATRRRGGPTRPAGLGGPNVVLVVLDDTGFAHFGCYGSELATPNIDRLAAGGLRYTELPHHRAVLAVAGRAAHRSQPPRRRHARRVELEHRLPPHAGRHHARGRRPSPSCCAAHGYATYAAGKWHLAPMEECSAAGPAPQLAAAEGLRPLLRLPPGRDRPVPPRAHPRQRPHRPAGRRPRTATTCPRTSSTESMRLDQRPAVGPARPAVLPLPRLRRHARAAPGAGRATSSGGGAASTRATTSCASGGSSASSSSASSPRARRWRRRNPGVPAWDDLTDEPAARSSARLQEAFAAMLEHTDAQIGRLVDFLEERGLLDDTLLHGAVRQRRVPRGRAVRRDGRVQLLQRACGRTSTSIVGQPPRRHRRPPLALATTRGAGPRPATRRCAGTSRTPTAAACATRSSSTGPNGIADRGATSATQFCHAVDIAPTILDATGVAAAGARATACRRCRCTAPRSRRRSTTPTRRRRGRCSTSSRWATAASGPTAGRRPPTTSQGQPFDDDEWGLFHLDEDFSECHDLAAEQPEKLRELIDAVVGRGRAARRAAARRPHHRAVRRRRPGRARRTPAASTCTARRWPTSRPTSRRRSAAAAGRSPPTVDVGDGGVEGVLYARGGHNVGHIVLRARTARCTSTTTRSAPTTGRSAPRRRWRRAATSSSPASSATARAASLTLGRRRRRPGRRSRSRSSCACSAPPGSTSAATRCRRWSTTTRRRSRSPARSTGRCSTIRSRADAADVAAHGPGRAGQGVTHGRPS